MGFGEGVRPSGASDAEFAGARGAGAAASNRGFVAASSALLLTDDVTGGVEGLRAASISPGDEAPAPAARDDALAAVGGSIGETFDALDAADASIGGSGGAAAGAA
jgi:hypothetical protein